jgi:hypothetical protein
MEQTTPPGQRNISVIVLGLIFVVIPIGVLAFNLNFVKSLISGPATMPSAELAQVLSPESLPNRWVSVQFDKAINTDFGIDKTSSKTGKTVSRSTFILIPCGDQFLLANMPENELNSPASGWVSTWTSSLEVQAVEKAKTKFPALRDKILPYQLDGMYKMRSQGFSMVGVCAFFFILGAVLLFTNLTKPKAPPVVNELA